VGVLAGIALTFALTGCLKMNVDLTVTPQDTLNGTMILGIDKSVATMSGQSEEDLRKQFTDAAPTSAPGTKVEPYSDDTYIGSKIIFTEVPLADLNKDTSNEQLRIVHDPKAKTYTVSGEVDLSPLNPSEPVAASFIRTLDVRIAITLPGDVIEHNGSLNGRTVTWVGKPGEKLTMHAVSEEGSTIPWLPILAIGIPTLLVIGGVVAWLLLRRRPTAPPPAEATQPEPAAPADPWQTPPAEQPTANLEAEQWSQPDREPGPAPD
jgi:hypothetical protein